ncbi:hypothetical protein GW17_00056301, partial [Ensete ventricosum]
SKLQTLRLGFVFVAFFAEVRRRLRPSSLPNIADDNLGMALPSNGEATTSSPRSSPRLRQQGGLADVAEDSPYPRREKKLR